MKDAEGILSKEQYAKFKAECDGGKTKEKTLRLVLPIAPDWIMRTVGLISLMTAVYAAGITLVQTDVRRFFCYLYLSYSGLVLVGLEAVTPISLTGALCVWMAVSA